MTSAHPLVSICIPTYNGERYLEEALRSAFEQTYTNAEIVISDDGSTDDTLNLIERFARRSPFPIHVHHHKPSGIGANWNNCIRHSSGEYIKFLFQDDLLMPSCVEKMVAVAETDPDVGLVYCRRRILYDAEDQEHREWMQHFAILHTAWAEVEVKEGIMYGRDLLGDPALWRTPRNKVGEPVAVMCRRSVFDTIGYFDERSHQVLDYLQWYRIMTRYKVAFIDEELAAFRLHGDQASNRNQAFKETERRLEKELMYRELGPYLHPALRRKLHNDIHGRSGFGHMLRSRLKQLIGR
jgi:glycosyltransferase involved in cell wall biosynthesis